MTETKQSLYGNLIDLIAKEQGTTGDQLFYTYKDKSEIGKKIFKELYKRFNQNPKRGTVGFYMDDSKEVGLLSQCQSLQALLLLASDFDLRFDDKHLLSDTKENTTIRDIMDMVIEDIIQNRLQKNVTTSGKYCFDASPYETDLFTEEYSNIESITWVVTTFLQALKYHAQIGETCYWEKQLESVIHYGLQYINDAFIESEGEGSSNKLEIGWNFTKKCEEPSLFFSFTVCETYVDFFETFVEYLTYKTAERDIKGKPMDEHFLELKAGYDEHMREYDEQLKKPDPGRHPVTDKQLTKFDDYHELRMRYANINKSAEIDVTTMYGELESKCLRVAKEIWRLTKDKLADSFFYNDLHTTMTEEDIGMATTSDALFNTVYIINIMVDAGLDELLLKEAHGEYADEKMQEYNNLLESCQLASQRTFRTYERLKNQGKDYIVDQFLIGFNERFVTHKDMVKELRKLRMRVFTLMPLLIRTNNVISEYLVKYPQANMRKYLGYILDNRYESEDKPQWIWEKDGFFSCSNYYYVSALGEFYAYYETYESRFIAIDASNQKLLQKIKDEHEGQLSKNGRIADLEKKVETQKVEIARLRDERDAKKTPVEDAVTEVIGQKLDQFLPAALCKYLTEAAAGLTTNNMNPAKQTKEHKELKDAMSGLLFALLSEHLYEQASATAARQKAGKDAVPQLYGELANYVDTDFKRIIRRYLADISNNQEHCSQWYYEADNK